MTPEHLPTEQYEAQLAEKVVRLQSMMAVSYTHLTLPTTPYV